MSECEYCGQPVGSHTVISNAAGGCRYNGADVEWHPVPVGAKVVGYSPTGTLIFDKINIRESDPLDAVMQLTREQELEVVLYGCLVEFGNPSGEDGKEWQRFYDRAYLLLNLPERTQELRRLAYPDLGD